MSLLRGLTERSAEVSIVTRALGYIGKWYGAWGGAGSHTATGTASKNGVSALVAQAGLDSCKVYIILII